MIRSSELENHRLSITSPSLLESLTIVPAQRRAPAAGEVEIEVFAVGLNFMEVLLALGMLSAPPSGIQFGLECAGVVTRCGEGVFAVAIGDAVLAVGESCLCRFVTVPAATLARIPPGVSFCDAATIPVAFITAYYALHELGRMRRGERVLIHAAAGGVGLAAVQWAQLAGAEIFATAGSEEKRAFLRSLGISHVMSSRSLDFAEEILRRTHGQGVDIVLNSLGGEYIAKGLSVLARRGRFVEMGKRDIEADAKLSLRTLAQGASFHVINRLGDPEIVGAILPIVLSHLAAGRLRPLPSHVYPLSQVVDAFSLMARAGHIGKVVVALHEQATQAPPPQQAVQEFAPPGKAHTVVSLSHAIKPVQGVAAFARILAGDRRQVVVSTVPLLPRLAGAAPAVVPLPILPQENATKEKPTRPLHPRPNLPIPYVAPRNPIEQQIAEIWQAGLGIAEIGVDDNFNDLGGDSLLAVQIMAKLRRRLSVHIAAHVLLLKPTIAELAQAVQNQEAESKSPQPARTSPLVQLRSGSVQPILFLVHPVGGHVYIYRDLAKSLIPEHPVYGLKAQGLDGLSAPLNSVEEMAELYISAIRTVQRFGPYALAGASFGGYVAYEMAHRLTQQGESVGLLALIDTAGPGYLPKRLRDDAEILSYLFDMGGDSAVSVDALRQLSADERRNLFTSRAALASELLPSFEGIEHFIAVWKASADAMWNYTPPVLENRILFFRALESDPYNSGTPERGWVDRVQGGLEFYGVPGNHITMNYLPNVSIIAERLSAYLRALRGQ